MHFEDRSVIQKVVTEADLVEINRLVSACDKYEGLDSPTTNTGMQAILCYEGKELVGLLAIQQGIDEVELYPIVQPEKRRKGIARTLLRVAKVQCKREGIGKCLLVCQESSESGKAFVKSTGSQYQFSEYSMKLDDKLFRKNSSIDFSIELRQAEFGDVKLLAGLTARSFGEPEEGHLERYTRDLLRPTRRFYIVLLDGQPIGTIGTTSSTERVYVVAFGITPEYRGRGYGGQALSKIIQTLLEEGPRQIMIEVVTDNRKALSLYKRCGFIEQSEYGYYGVSI